MKASNPIVLVLFLVGAWLHSLSPAWAQDNPRAMPSVVPPDSELDALLASRNWSALGSALGSPANLDALTRGMNWLRPKVNNGGGLLLALMYSNDLWIFGNSAKIEDPNKDLRLSAAVMSLYAYELIVIDGFKCEDQSAPIGRANNFLAGRREMWAFLNGLPVAKRAELIDVSLALEKRTSPL